MGDVLWLAECFLEQQKENAVFRNVGRDVGQLTLGELIDKLEAAPKESQIQFDFCHCVTCGVDSYRGFYEQLAIGWAPQGSGRWPNVADFLPSLRDAVGKTFTGYKGGEYRMDRGTPVWVSNYGETSSTAVVGVIPGEYQTLLLTAYVDL